MRINNLQIINFSLTTVNDSDWTARHNSRRTLLKVEHAVRETRRNVWMKFCGLLARLIVARLLRFRRERSFRDVENHLYAFVLALSAICTFVI